MHDDADNTENPEPFMNPAEVKAASIAFLQQCIKVKHQEISEQEVMIENPIIPKPEVMVEHKEIPEHKVVFGPEVKVDGESLQMVPFSRFEPEGPSWQPSQPIVFRKTIINDQYQETGHKEQSDPCTNISIA